MTTEATEKELREKLALDLFLAFHDSATNFNAQLFRLMSKADPGNLVLISMGFPLNVEIYREWLHSMEERDFFTKYLLGKRLAGKREGALLDSMLAGPHRRDGGRGEGEGAESLTGDDGW